ncbi:MAG: META domain-containing protein [Luteitalea sp.]|nr:META domain-containing protein [Luteitalea sp.]
MLRRTLIALGFMMAVSACDDGPTSPSDVVGETWRLVSLQEAGSTTPVIVPDPSRYTVAFGDDDSLGVMSDCNSCGGSYALSGSTLTVSALACTKVFCGDTSLDSRFTAGLQQAQTITLDDDEMTIQSAAGVLRFSN